MQKERKSHKNIYTATHLPATYTGNHPQIAGKSGVYYFSTKQQAYVFRPESDEKSDWYRVMIENLQVTKK